MTAPNTPPRNLPNLSVRQIAAVVRKDWKNVYFAAVPYLRAMSSMETVGAAYGLDSGHSIIRYFLSNARTWRGTTARAVKAELKKRLK